MCGRFVQKDVAAAERFFSITRSPGWQPSFNIAPSQQAGIIRIDPKAGTPVLEPCRWGLIPRWVKDAKAWTKPINARVETVFQKPAFRALIHRQRCLVPADGWFEWQSLAGRKRPFYLSAPDNEPLGLAGVYDLWEGPEGPCATFAILTAPAPESVAQVHDRAPVALRQEDFAPWLDPHLAEREPTQAMLARRRTEFRCHGVSTRVNRPANNDPDLLTPVEEA